MDFSKEILAKNKELVSRINKIELKNICFEDEVRLLLLENLTTEDCLLDCGKSLREYFDLASKITQHIFTLDINKFEDYPDWFVDICDSNQVAQIPIKFDVISAFNLLEHCYDPFTAAHNLTSLLNSDGGIIYGSAPFLYPHHGPSDLSYQDYFRFTRDSYALLFPAAKKIELFPTRGRLATSINVLSLIHI